MHKISPITCRNLNLNSTEPPALSGLASLRGGYLARYAPGMTEVCTDLFRPHQQPSFNRVPPLQIQVPLKRTQLAVPGTFTNHYECGRISMCEVNFLNWSKNALAAGLSGRCLCFTRLRLKRNCSFGSTSFKSPFFSSVDTRNSGRIATPAPLSTISL